jgi:hypothetical protein
MSGKIGGPPASRATNVHTDNTGTEVSEVMAADAGGDDDGGDHRLFVRGVHRSTLHRQTVTRSLVAPCQRTISVTEKMTSGGEEADIWG